MRRKNGRQSSGWIMVGEFRRQIILGAEWYMDRLRTSDEL